MSIAPAQRDAVTKREAMLDQIADERSKTVTIHPLHLATALTGEAVVTNRFMLGFAWQQGLVPSLESSLTRAIESNKAAVEMNRPHALGAGKAANDPSVALLAACIGKAIPIWHGRLILRLGRWSLFDPLPPVVLSVLRGPLPRDLQSFNGAQSHSPLCGRDFIKNQTTSA